MRKFAPLALLAAALAVPSIAAAATPQGKLTGSATVGGGVHFGITAAVIDGGTDPLYIGKENDRSGNCNGDSGTLLVGGGTPVYRNVVCAHYVASSRDNGNPKMRLAYESLGFYTIVRITDNGASPDTLGGPGQAATLAEARAWVNMGRIGGGFAASPWQFPTVLNGDYTVTASQA